MSANSHRLQSHGGRMRFFPAWNATALGPASFATLRAYGAFVVSASVDARGTVSPVALGSDVGGDVVFESPWAADASPTVTDGAGAVVPTTKLSVGVYSFGTNAGGQYKISAGGTLL